MSYLNINYYVYHVSKVVTKHTNILKNIFRYFIITFEKKIINVILEEKKIQQLI
jgi:hypothetical protein